MIRRMRAVGHVARRRERRVPYMVLVGGLKESDDLEDVGLEERMI
jgi:hypothetical protein